MSAEATSLLASVAAAGGDLDTLRRVAHDRTRLSERLRALGFAKLGDRLRISQALAQDVLAATSAADPGVSASKTTSPPAAITAYTPGGASAVRSSGPTEWSLDVAGMEDVLQDGGILKRVQREGAADGGKPSIPSKVKLRCVGRLAADGARFESGLSVAPLGEGMLIRGLERGVLTMQRGETSVFLFRPEYAFGAQGKPAAGPGLAGVSAGASVVYEVELISWEAPKREAWEMSRDERMEEALRLKSEGARHFGSGAWRDAQAAYRAASRLLLDQAPIDGYESLGELRAPEGREAEARGALVACLLNEAACALHTDDSAAATRACTAALAQLTDPLGADVESHVKALYRRGKARASRSEFEAAREDLRQAAKLAPGNKEVRAFWEKLLSLEEERRQGGKAVLTKMGVAGATAGLYRGLHLRPRRANPRPRVWMDISIGGKPAGRITFELFAEALPRTCRNFRALCTGEMGISPRTGKPLCYRGSRFHRAVNTDDDPPQYLREGADGTGRSFEIWKGMFVQGGDIEHGDGTGNESIYGQAFEDEGFEFKHNDKYLLSMAGTPPMRHREAEARAHVPHRNGSQFFITTKSTTQNLGGASITHFDYRHVVFGRVASREGIGVVNRIQKLPTEAAKGHRISEAVVITGCGEAEPEEPAGGCAGAEEEAPQGKAWFEQAAAAEAAEERARAAAALERGVPQLDLEDQVRSAEVDDD